MRPQISRCKMKNGSIAALLMLLLIGGDLGFTSVVLAGDFWTIKADMPILMSGLSTIVVNGKIYVVGGTTGQMWIEQQQSSLSVVEEYDLVRDTWTEKTSIPTERFGSSVSVVNGKICVIGGYDDNGLLSIVEEYDPMTDTWSEKADMLTSRTGLSTSVVNGRIYAIGGEKLVGGALSSVEEYDPVTDTWTKKADMTTPRSGLSTVVVNGMIYAIGGTNMQAVGGEGRQMGVPSTMEEYDPSTDTWIQKADIPTPQSNTFVIVANNRIYVIGGGRVPAVGGEIGRMLDFSAVEEYDPSTDTWTQKADMPTARFGLSATTVSGKIYAIGGATTQAAEGRIGQTILLPTVEEYTPGDWAVHSVSPAGKLATKWGKIKTEADYGLRNLED